ncbi:Plasma membrane fusion protein PRM1 [Mycena kentingensis (nom. inval.)]|nr:Plasma membrane fusion protein PRM1 [Mycena kentingensis (nom. inval.)]
MSSWNAAPPTYDTHSTTRLRPYLQLPHKLSLTWLAYPILSLIFVIFRLQLSLSSSQDAVANAKSDLVTSCKAAERAATAAASMPRYMALATNERITSAVDESMNAARAALILALTVMEAIINFIIDIYRSTFLCFLELVIRGGLAILIGAVDELNVVVKAAAGGIHTAVDDAFGAATSALNGISSVAGRFGISIPTLTPPDLSALDNVALPQSFTDALTNLNNTLPTFNDLKEAVEEFVDTPFELLKKEINETFTGLSFDSSVLAVPQQNNLVFCDDLDTSFVDNLGRDLAKMTKIAIVLCIVAIVILIGLNCLLEWYKWRCQQRHLEYTRQAWNTDPTLFQQTSGGVPTVTLSDHNLLMLQANGAHPLLTRIANNLSRKLRLSPTNHIHLQWFLHYIFHPPALACFLLGFVGLLSVELQLLAMGPLVDKYSGQAATTAADFSNTIATNINGSMYNQSAAYAASVNGQVASIQSTINNGLFGWVNTTTTTLNTTIETFYEDIQKGVDTVFKGTILDAPIQEFIKCLIGSKVDAIENALTFLHDNLNIDMPRVNDSVLVLSPESVNEATQPIALAAVGDGKDDGGLVGRLVNVYAASLRKERIMFAVFLILWGVVVLMGLCVILWHSYGQPLAEKRQRRKYLEEQRGFPGAAVEEKGYVSPNPENDKPAFAPLPSPKSTGSFNPFKFGRSKTNDDGPQTMNNIGAQSSNRSWDSFFDKRSASNISTKEISKPMKLVSTSRRGREVLLGDRNSDARSTRWFGRFADMLSKKEQIPEIEPYPAFSPNNRNSAMPPPQPQLQPARPVLRIQVDQASPTTERTTAQPERSRWSVSPDTTARTPATPWTNGSPWRHKAKPSVPSNVPSTMDVNSILEGVGSPVQQTPLAMPLHSGFDVPRKQAILPHHPGVAYPAPLPKQHRKSLSVPRDVRDPFSDAYNLNPNVPSVSPEGPVTRLLTTTNARRSSSVDPFVTPFDDEHRVTMAHAHAVPAGNRKSIPTNPFTGVAL